MAWTVFWSEKSIKQLKKIDKKTAQRIYDGVLDCTEDPFAHVTRLTGSKFYRLRAGNYRVILDLRQKKLIIFVIQADNRKRVYKQ